MIEQAVTTGQSRTTSNWVNWVLPSLSDAVFIILVIGALSVRAEGFINGDGDLGRHIAVGREILGSGRILHVDLFSHTRSGDPFVPYEWLAEITHALIHSYLGIEGVIIFSAVLAALPFFLLARWMIRDGANVLVVLALTTTGAAASSIHWLARPHLFTTLAATIWVRLLMRHRQTGNVRYLAALPALMVLWTNLHGGFLVGFVVLATFIVASLISSWEAIKGELTLAGRSKAAVLRGEPAALIVAGIASLLAVGLNPAGYAVIPHVLSYFGETLLVNNTHEYMSPNFHSLGPRLFLLLLLVTVLSLAAAPRRAGLGSILTLAVWIAFALHSARNIPLFVVICLPIVAGLVTEALREIARTSGKGGSGGKRPGLSDRLAAIDRRLGKPLLPLVFVLALFVTGGSLVGGKALPSSFSPSVFPVEALSKANAIGAKGNVFNYFTWGGYILYAGYPEHRVFIDGQTDFYGEELARDYLAVARLEPNWEEVLDRYDVGWVLFPHEAPLTLMLRRSEGWQLVHEDATADIFIRSRS